MLTQDQLDALDEAGRLLAPILQAMEMNDQRPAVSLSRDGRLMVNAYVDKDYKHHVAGTGDSLSAAASDFIAKRDAKLVEVAAEEAERAEFEAWKAQREQAA